jgi:hypothetical protein
LTVSRILSRIRCAITGHPDRYTAETDTAVTERCIRCHKRFSRNLTYYGKARAYQRRVHIPSLAEPVKSIEDDSGNTLSIDDYILWPNRGGSAFPGLGKWENGRVQYLFETKYGERWIKVRYEQYPVHEWELYGVRKAEDGPAPKPGLFIT